MLLGSYYMHIMSNIDGIDISQLEEKTMRSGAYSTLVPAVREKVRLSVQGPRSAGEWSRARDVCQDRARLKFTLPGPMTLMDGMVNIFYQDETELAADLVSCINQEVLELARVGCKHIQIDEPVMMRYPDKALAFGLDNLAKCFAGLPGDVTKVTKRYFPLTVTFYQRGYDCRLFTCVVATLTSWTLTSTSRPPRPTTTSSHQR